MLCKREYMEERVQKILAAAGVASRRKCEELIARGEVLVNGKVISLGDKADPDKDEIVVKGEKVEPEKKVYILVHKPKGVVTTVSEKHGMETILDLVDVKQRVFPVGRLDKPSEGLLILTNDGELTNLLTHPRYGVEKEYYVVLNKVVPERVVRRLKNGVTIDGRKVVCSKVRAKGDEVILSIHEGRKHIVRRLFGHMGLRVKRLVRTKTGPLSLGRLQPGKWRFLTKGEVSALRRAAEA